MKSSIFGIHPRPGIVGIAILALLLAALVFTVLALAAPGAAQAQATTDYDADDDSLIEVSNLAQLNAIRWDLDGNGTASGGYRPYYAAAFPNPLTATNTVTAMGCPTGDHDNDANTPDEPGCTGYELAADLDFGFVDSDGDGDITVDDFDTDDSGTVEADEQPAGWAYWNGGSGWLPIGYNNSGDPDSTSFNAAFEGNGHTIANLFIYWDSSENLGLFGVTGSSAAVRNLGLTNVNVTGDYNNYVGGLVGRNWGGSISASYATGRVSGGQYVGGLVGRNWGGSISASYATSSVSGRGYVGGLVGRNWGGSISASYATGSVSGAHQVGGLVGGNWGGSISASYATGRVSGRDYVGGLVGYNDRSISASYATGRVTGTGSYVGGLVGHNNSGSGSIISASYATGRVTGTGSYVGGLVGRNQGSISASYWVTETSGLTSLLRAPSAYGAGTDIYADWNLDLDNADGDGDTTTGGDDPWDFGADYNYPVLKADFNGDGTATWQEFGRQREPGPLGSLAAALNSSSNIEITWTAPTDTGGGTLGDYQYRVSTNGGATWDPDWTDTSGLSHTITVAAGRSYTFEARATNGAAHKGAISRIGPPGLPDSLTLTAGDTRIDAAWTAPSGDGGLPITGYSVQYRQGGSGVWQDWPHTGTGTTGAITGLTNPQDYWVRVSARNVMGTTIDYDADDDGLIEISNLAQLNAIRWDLDRDGTASTGNESDYAAAFPNLAAGMGCPTGDHDNDANTPDEPVCGGYELTANLDFDTDGDGATFTMGDHDSDPGTPDQPIADSGDDYHNGGSGWLPIGDNSGGYYGNPYSGVFEGNGHTISNLFIDRGSTDYIGLFGYTLSSAVRNLGLVNVNVSGSASVGGLVGYNSGSISASYATGSVSGSASVGGLVGRNWGGSISASYATGRVTGSDDSVGGLVGYNSNRGIISASYATGSVTGEDYVGGLVGYNRVGYYSGSGGIISASYATGSVTGDDSVGGLVGYNRGSGSIISASYATGRVTGTGSYVGGLVGSNYNGSISASYWDMETSGLTRSAAGTGKTGAELRAPSAYGAGTDIYADWNLDLDNADGDGDTATGGDDPWDFGADYNYPVLKADFNGDGTATWQEFGRQREPGPLGSLAAALNSSSNIEITWAAPTDTGGGTLGDYQYRVSTNGGATWDPDWTDTSRLSHTITVAAGRSYTFEARATNGAAHKGAISRIGPPGPLDSLTLTAGGTQIDAAWTAPSGDGGLPITGYSVQYRQGGSGVWQDWPHTGTGTTGAVTGLTNPQDYQVRVAARNTMGTGPYSAHDYDADNDGLIEISNLAQLNAIRWDLDGDGTASTGNESDYAAAFPDPFPGMGCLSSCVGYELTANLDFDTDGDGAIFTMGDHDSDARTPDQPIADSGDDYHNGGSGWRPIGDHFNLIQGRYSLDSSFVFDSTFEGNGHTISNLFIGRARREVGLFGITGSSAVIRNLGLTNVSVYGSYGSVGGLVGQNTGNISASYATGSVTSTSRYRHVGGLVGRNSGSISASYATGSVSGNSSSVGGLVGTNSATGSISASYATGSVTGTGGRYGAYTGGLVGRNYEGSISASYATGRVYSSSSYDSVGGLVGRNYRDSSISASYWDTETTGRAVGVGSDDADNNGAIDGAETATAGATSKTTTELKAPTGYTGIYANWNIDLDNADGDDDTATGGDDPWDFGADYSYPVLKADSNGDGTATWREFGLPTGQTFIDYDTDDDGLIEISNLAQLNVIRGDNNGDGKGDYAGFVSSYYLAAYPSSVSVQGRNPGCPSGCTGYELTADLDFDTDGDGATFTMGDHDSDPGTPDQPIADSGDDYHNGGSGWLPIGSSDFDGDDYNLHHFSSVYDATFEGNGHTIANLFIQRNSYDYLDGEALFGSTGPSAVIRNLGLVNVSVSGGQYVGGLVSSNGGSISASYATGRVTGTGSYDAYTGGLVGRNWGGSISASYATGRVYGSYGSVGGLVGQNTGNISASYATGSVTSTSGGYYSASNGGLVGRNSGSISASYWDTETTGRAVGVGSDDADNNGAIDGAETATAGATSKTTAELKAPTGYTGIYADWNIDLDNADGDDDTATGGDDPWDFGADYNYPVLKADFNGDGTATWQEFGRQREPGPLGSFAAAPDSNSNIEITWTAPTDTGGGTLGDYQYRVSTDGGATWDPDWTDTSGLSHTITVAAGRSYTFEARATNGAAHKGAISRIGPPGPVDSLTLTAGDTRIDASWTAPSGDGGSPITGYSVQYRQGGSGVWQDWPHTGTGTTGAVTGLTNPQDYQVRVSARNVMGTGLYDYDADDDGLIEISSLAQLNAIRWDLDRDGSVTDDAATTDANEAELYAAAFPNPAAGMGCPATGCVGYELTANLDFDTDGDGATFTMGDHDSDPGTPDQPIADSGDNYHNGGSGWMPIGDTIGAYYGNLYSGVFEGNGHTISNLFIDRGSTVGIGLFGITGSSAVIRNLGLVNVNVSGNSSVGGLVGVNNGSISASYATGRVTGTGTYVGGLVGRNNGSISASYATSRATGSRNNVGGLVGRNNGSISASYATGRVTGTGTYVGGLVGRNNGSISASYATGRVTGTGTYVGGLVGQNYRGSISASYWDTETTGRAVGVGSDDADNNGAIDGAETATAGATSKTTAELKAPTGYTGIYADWNLDLDNADGDDDPATGGDDPWNFGTSQDYPVLKAPSVAPANQPPGAPALAAQTATEDQAFSYTFEAVTDPDGDAVSYTAALDDGSALPGWLTFDGDTRAFSGTPLEADTPASLTIEVTATDDGEPPASASATFTLTVAEVNDAPEATDDTATVAEGGAVEIAASTLLSNDSDPEEDTLSITAVADALNGAATLSEDGATVTYTHDGSETTSSSFTYTLSDGAATATGTVTLTVTPVNDAPEATDDTSTVAEGGAVEIAASTLLSNDADAEEDTLSITAVADALNGAATLSEDGNTVAYTHDGSETTSGSFTYTLSDGTATATGTVTLTVTPVNDAPEANAGADQTVMEDDTVTLDGSGSSDPESDTLTYTWSQTGGTAVTLTNANTAAASFTAPEGPASLEFSLVVNDGTVDSSPGTVAVTVAAGPVGSLSAALDSSNNIEITWTAPTGAGSGTLGGYQYRVSTDGGAAWNPDWTDTSATSHTITPAANTSYTVEVRATSGADHSPGVVSRIGPLTITDYDADDDGLIEVGSLAQLNAIRWDPDGDGSAANAGYADAFPFPQAGMGCPASGCVGYELTAGLDFDTDGSGGANDADDYWNGGSGWEPIMDFEATLEGNGHAIANLFIDREDDQMAGLFGSAGPGAVIRNLTLTNVSVTGDESVAGLAGENEGSISGVSVSGSVSGEISVGGLAGYNAGSIVSGAAGGTVTGYTGEAGGLVGYNDGTIRSSSAAAAVSAPAGGVGREMGGLAGHNAGTITASHATGSVSGFSETGGLVGGNGSSGTITASYATGGVTGSASAGGLVGGNSGLVSASYSTGVVSGAANAGGLVGLGTRGAVTNSYYDQETSGRAFGIGSDDLDNDNTVDEEEVTDASGRKARESNTLPGSATAELQTPTDYTGIYETWDDHDIDGDGSADAPWNFGTDQDYPALE